MAHIIQLTTLQVAKAVEEAQRRCEIVEARKGKDHTSKDDAQDLGCMVELAFADWTGWEWTGFAPGNPHPPDVGPCEVRGSTRKEPLLYFKDFDDGSRPFVLGSIDKNTHTVTFHGWMYGDFCKRRQWWATAKDPKNMRPNQKCWWQVPAESLWPFEFLWALTKEDGCPPPNITMT